MCEDACREQGMHLPSAQHIRVVRATIGALHHTLHAIALAECDGADCQFDATPMDGEEYVASPQQLRSADGSSETWYGGAVRTADQSADGEAALVAEHGFADKTKYLEALRARLEKIGTRADAAAAALPTAQAAAHLLSKLAQHATSTDNASAAIAAQRALAKLVATEVQALLEADGSWPNMSADERAEVVKVYQTTCSRHLSNTFIDGGAKAEQQWLGGKLEEDLAAPDAKALRLSADVTALVRAVSKDVGEGIKLYAKGSGSKFRAWLEKHHAGALFMHVTRVDLGVRQDAKTEAAFALYYNRPIIVDFLETVLVLKKEVRSEMRVSRRAREPTRVRELAARGRLLSIAARGAARSRAHKRELGTRCARARACTHLT